MVVLGLAVVLAVAALLLWRGASEDQDADALAAEYERAILLDQGNPELAATVDMDPAADRSQALVVGGLAVVAAVGGVVLLRLDG